MAANGGDRHSSRAAHLLAKLTGHGLQPDVIFGGRAEIDRMDVAAALAGHNKLAYLLNRAKYCDDVACVMDALRLLVVRASSEDERIRDCGDKPFRIRVCARILEEWRSGNLCNRCRGRGSLYPTDAAAFTCPKCNGTGRFLPTAISRSRSLNVPVEEWRNKHLQKAVSDWLSEMHHQETTGLWYVAQHLGIFDNESAA